MKSAFIVLNPKVGNCDVDAVRRAVERCLGGDGWTHRVYEMDGQERVGRPIRAALAQGFDVFVAIGDDGTVSAVADGLVRSGVPLGIVPAGTGNALAQDLGIPADLEASLELVVGQHDVKSIDAMRVGDRFAVRNVGIGISALMMRDTGHSAKQWLGLTAYVKTGLSKLLGFQPYQFTVVVDGQRSEWRASEVMVVNSGAIGDPYLHWGPQVRLNDRQLDVCIMRAKSVIDYLRLAWNVLLRRQGRDPHLRCLSVKERVFIRTEEPLLVQVDGEIIGETPVRVHVVPDAIRVIVPGGSDAGVDRDGGSSR